MEENLENVTEKLENAAENLKNEEQTVVEPAEEAAETVVRTVKQEPESEPEEEPQPEMETTKSCETGKKCHLCHLIFDLLLLAAVIALFVLHFCGNSCKKSAVVPKPVEVGTGEVVFVNIDSVNEKFEMIKILKELIQDYLLTL